MKIILFLLALLFWLVGMMVFAGSKGAAIEKPKPEQPAAQP